MRTKAEIVRVWRTQNIYRFVDDEATILVAYQIDQRGCHRLCVVDKDGNDVAPGDLAVYEHPTFATFGKYQFIALTEYFEGDVLNPQVVYRLEHGDYAGEGKDVEEDGKDEPVRIAVVEDERPKEPVEGWYIDSMYAEEYGMDLIQLVVQMSHPNEDDKEIQETLDPGIGDLKEIRAEEHGGEGKWQQSIVVIAEGHGDRGAEVQVEIDYKTGEFKDESLNGWEQSDA